VEVNLDTRVALLGRDVNDCRPPTATKCAVLIQQRMGQQVWQGFTFSYPHCNGIVRAGRQEGVQEWKYDTARHRHESGEKLAKHTTLLRAQSPGHAMPTIGCLRGNTRRRKARLQPRELRTCYSGELPRFPHLDLGAVGNRKPLPTSEKMLLQDDF
jgi:hypothetical protein